MRDFAGYAHGAATDDHRAHAIRLTDHARKILKAVESEADAVESEIFAPLDETERTLRLLLLQRIAAHAGLPAGVHPDLQ